MLCSRQRYFVVNGHERLERHTLLWKARGHVEPNGKNISCNLSPFFTMFLVSAPLYRAVYPKVEVAMTEKVISCDATMGAT